MMNDLDLAYEYKLKSLPRGKDVAITVLFFHRFEHTYNDIIHHSSLRKK